MRYLLSIMLLLMAQPALRAQNICCECDEILLDGKKAFENRYCDAAKKKFELAADLCGGCQTCKLDGLTLQQWIAKCSNCDVPPPPPPLPPADDFGPKMILVRGGYFDMGSTDGDSDEKPVHTVTVSDFYMGETEVTVAQFRAFVAAANYTTEAEKDGGSWIWDGKTWTKTANISWRNNAEGGAAQDNHPVIHVSWNDAVAYCKWISGKTGKTYRLPTEAEWEYAAGGGASGRTKWAGASTETALPDYTWLSSNSDNNTHPVKTKKPNALGLYDMIGNVWEWCADWKGDYTAGAQTNPTGPSSGSNRVYRGGGWGNNPLHCRVATRAYGSPTGRSCGVGFRVVRLL